MQFLNAKKKYKTIGFMNNEDYFLPPTSIEEMHLPKTTKSKKSSTKISSTNNMAKKKL